MVKGNLNANNLAWQSDFFRQLDEQGVGFYGVRPVTIEVQVFVPLTGKIKRQGVKYIVSLINKMGHGRLWRCYPVCIGFRYEMIRARRVGTFIVITRKDAI